LLLRMLWWAILRAVLQMWFRPRRINMIVQVDANGLGKNLRKARIDSLCGRIPPRWPDQRRATSTRRGS
jgi:hypothetical protein